MRTIRKLAIAGLLLALSACGGKGFAPSAGPFSGTLTTSDGPIGTFSFTTTADGLLGGSGTISAGGNVDPISLTGLISGTQIAGNLSNVNLGSGDFKGRFLSATIASGTFTYVDTAQTVHLSGTWEARP
jgi:hypothetical protein